MPAGPSFDSVSTCVRAAATAIEAESRCDRLHIRRSVADDLDRVIARPDRIEPFDPCKFGHGKSPCGDWGKVEFSAERFVKRSQCRVCDMRQRSGIAGGVAAIEVAGQRGS